MMIENSRNSIDGRTGSLLQITVFLNCVALIFILTGCSGKAKKANSNVRKPNILFISIDSLRSDHLGCYNYFRDTTPNIDRLSEKGTLFLNGISNTSWTLPSHMSMFTGLYILQHGVKDKNLVLSLIFRNIKIAKKSIFSFELFPPFNAFFFKEKNSQKYQQNKQNSQKPCLRFILERTAVK